MKGVKTMTHVKNLERAVSLGRFSLWVGLSFLVAFALAVGVGLAATLAWRGTSEDWSRWSDVGQTFGALSSIIAILSLAAVVITARIQFRELQGSVAANLSAMHLEIMRMSVDDLELADVWPAYAAGLSATQNRQYLYANIIYQFHWTSLKLNKASDEDVVASMRYLFTSPIMRGYWTAGKHIRASLNPGGPEYLFAAKLDNICAEYDDPATPDA
ncbi:hypothetical protein HH310_34390 [Actinoplanes sp. TBRC 11911]|uniref:DUF6082 family protein n=1 Tax=Actinoplanes sp. TBRC 11911 TaxID=2729386 RepID=UPI00145D1D09|nr:DUF6082 family protein [Actinoplanes sp. TBRC 11911]NMO56254.1 hypothetical protein [Actinoplanes sp. TBRC 11911]